MIKKRIVVGLVSVCMAATLGLGLVGCGGGNPGQQIADTVTQLTGGDVTGKVGNEYATKWFNFTVNSMSTNTSFAGHTAADGNKLVIANITITNTFGTPQTFGTFDWFVMGDGSAEIYPLPPLNNSMMPENFEIKADETVTCDVVVEFPEDLKNPFFMYTEVDEQGSVFASFKIPIS